MRKILQLALNDLRIFFSSQGNLVSLLLVPVIMTLVVGVFSSGGGGEPSAVPVDILDQDNSPMSVQLLASIRQANPSLVFCPMDNTDEDRCMIGEATSLDINQVKERVEDGITRGAVVIPGGFDERVHNFEPVRITLYAQGDLGAPGILEQSLQAAIQSINGAVIAARTGSELVTGQGLAAEIEDLAAFELAIYDRAAQIWSRDPTTIRMIWTGEAELQARNLNLQEGLGQSVPGMGSMFVMFTVFGGMTALIVERKQWTLQRLGIAPLSRAQLLGGKILGRFTLGILQFMVVFAVGVLAGINLGADPFALVLVAVSYTLAITALSFALGTWLRNEAQASGFSLLLSLVLAPLGGAWWPLEIVPRTMQVIGHASPVAWAMDAFNVLIFNQGDIQDILLPCLVLLGIAILSFGIGAARFDLEG